MNPGDASIAEIHATQADAFDIVLSPVSHPALGAIRICDELFAIGRSEAPFDEYPRELLTKLSRRHARIFMELGDVYVADLDSKNGTTLNGVAVQQIPSRVRAGDELNFGGELSYRVGIAPRARVVKPRAPQAVSLTLHPERSDLGLQPIDVHAFPFLVSKADDLFARYKERFPHQVNYISRRHAHIFLKGGTPFIEDLGSTNGTFVGGKRLDEIAVPLNDGDVVAFGGDHFVYKLALHNNEVIEPTVTQMLPAPGAASTHAQGQQAAEASDADKTLFVGAAHSFLEIFCVDRAMQREDEINDASIPTATDLVKQEKHDRHDRHDALAIRTPRPARPPSRGRVLLTEMSRAFAGNDRTAVRRIAWGGFFVVVAIAAVGIALHMRGASEREIRDMLAAGNYETASRLANDHLKSHPSDTQYKALGTEALMKALVPTWLSALNRRDFNGASATIERMKALGAPNSDASALIVELQWVGDLERFVTGRGGPDAPIRLYADEPTLNDLLRRWNDDAQNHQRTLDRVASYVPAFNEPYAQAMSHLRKLQSDDSVYLAAIDRLNTTIATELARDRPDALPSVFDDYAQRYPRLAGLDRLRDDLRRYTQLLNDLLARRLVPLLASLKTAHFSTPPFQAQFQQLQTSRLPSTDVIARHDAVTAAWQRGDSQQALAGLQAIPAGPWSDALGKEQAHKKAVADQYAEVRKARGTGGYDDRLLAFYGALDPVEDAWYVRAVQTDVTAMRDKALSRAQAMLARAQSAWRQYRAGGSIGGAQRLETGISERFRSEARLLSDARTSAQQGIQIYTQLKATHPDDWDSLLSDIDDEADLQRRSLEDLRMVLEPGVLQAKLALIGGDSNETR
ncbi:FHA domain-containing protein [Paraburkholderia sp.]|uniref:FHA domain-containing protein n=1 Tax=Paraburkholderia sp. TaxID=1926495 RepID=UPI002385454B|nr:FHA domain-containing protein [Paraburkholderia sp.]MDE1184293.1 FHA domain-containing protein [Paraburkholderia sp.]